MRIIGVLTLLIYGCTHSTVIQPSQVQNAYSYQCKILDMNGKVLKRIPFSLCDYFEDGKVIASDQNGMALLAPEGLLLWQKKINCHHNIRILNQDKIIVMNSSFHHFKGEWARFDRISIYDLQGNELKYFDFYEHLEQIFKFVPPEKQILNGETFILLQKSGDFLNVENGNKYSPVMKEFAHANSVYEIQENKLSYSNPAFAAGNFIVNVNGIGFIFILDKDLKNILWAAAQPRNEKSKSSLHDVQVTNEGNLLYFNNVFNEDRSSIELMNPATFERTIIFKGSEVNKFFGSRQGSVQRLDNGHYLIAKFDKLNNSELLEVTGAGKLVKTMTLKTLGLEGKRLDSLQEVKQRNLDSFLKNNTSLF